MEVIQGKLKTNLANVLSQPPISATFRSFPGLLPSVVEDLLLTQRSKDKLIRDCYQHNIIIDNEGNPHSIAEGLNMITLGPASITAGDARIINGRHTTRALFRGEEPIAGVSVAGVRVEQNNIIKNEVYVLGKLPIVFTDPREAESPAWADLFMREARRTIIRESAELKVTMPLNPELKPLLMVNYPNPILESLTGIELWTVETVSHRVSGSQASTTLNCKVLYENGKWRGG